MSDPLVVGLDNGQTVWSDGVETWVDGTPALPDELDELEALVREEQAA